MHVGKRIAVENYEVRERDNWVRGSYINSFSVPPSAFTTFHLGMLTNADVLKIDVKTYLYYCFIVIDSPIAEYNPIVQGVLQYLIWAEP